MRGQRPRPCVSPSSAGASSPGPALFVCPGVRAGLWLYLGGRWESLPAGSPAGHGHDAHVMHGRYK